MIRRLLVTLPLFTPLLLLAQQPGRPFIIYGDLSGLPEQVEKVYIMYVRDGERVTDSAIVQAGKFQLKGKIQEPTLATLRPRFAAANGKPARSISGRRDIASVFLDATAMKLVAGDSLSHIVVSGSKPHQEYKKLESDLKPYMDKMSLLMQDYYRFVQAKDRENTRKISDRLDQLQESMNNEVYGSYVKNNPASPIAIYALQRLAGYDINVEVVDPLFRSLPAEARLTPSGRILAEKLEIARKTGIGRPAMEFVQNDTSGRPVSLSSFRGKYVLVDFWASWCGPCRQENPNVVKVFQRFRNRGFEVLGISLDRPGQRDRWLEAIHEDRLTWTHVSDLQFWNNAVARQYGIQAIPQNLLVDPKGIIIARNLRGEDLEKKLADIFEN